MFKGVSFVLPILQRCLLCAFQSGRKGATVANSSAKKLNGRKNVPILVPIAIAVKEQIIAALLGTTLPRNANFE